MLRKRGDTGKGGSTGTQKCMGSHSFPYHVVHILHVSLPKTPGEIFVKAASLEFAWRRVY